MRFVEWKAMLRITVHEEGGQCRLELAGKLCGPWVDETKNVWRSQPSSGKEIEVDLRGVRGVDTAGRELLVAMHQAGARLIAEGVWMMALVEEISGKQPLNASERQRRKKSLRNNEDSQTRRHT